mgnify:CR=1 FL=1
MKLIEVLPFIVTIVVVIVIGFMILEETEENIKNYHEFCNNKYGENNWEERPNGTCGLALKYSCYPIENITNKEDN